jgi:hypothetical protein
MAIKISNTTVLDDSRQLVNITGVDSATKAAFDAAGIGGASLADDVTITGPATLPLNINVNYTLSSDSHLVDQNIVSFTYDIDGGSATTVAAAGQSATITLNIGGNVNDTHTLNVFGTDGLGNNTATETLNITMITEAVAAPTITNPSNGATGVTQGVTFTASSFGTIGGSADTHQSTDWQVATDAGFSNVVASSLNDTSNKTSITLTNPNTGTTYYARARYRGTTFGYSAYSATVSYTTATTFDGTAEFYGSPYNYTWVNPGLDQVNILVVGGGGGQFRINDPDPAFGRIVTGGNGAALGWVNGYSISGQTSIPIKAGRLGPNASQGSYNTNANVDGDESYFYSVNHVRANSGNNNIANNSATYHNNYSFGHRTEDGVNNQPTTVGVQKASYGGTGGGGWTNGSTGPSGGAPGLLNNGGSGDTNHGTPRIQNSAGQELPYGKGYGHQAGYAGFVKLSWGPSNSYPSNYYR